jgi:hypothetical protein
MDIGDKIQTKSTDNLVHKIMAKISPNLEKERVIQVQEVHKTPNHQDQ